MGFLKARFKACVQTSSEGNGNLAAYPNTPSINSNTHRPQSRNAGAPLRPRYILWEYGNPFDVCVMEVVHSSHDKPSLQEGHVELVTWDPYERATRL